MAEPVKPSGLLAIHPACAGEVRKAYELLSREMKRATMDRNARVQYGEPGDLYALQENGIAEIEICGPLVDLPEWVECCGYCSYERIRKQVFKAQTDPRVSAIRLVIDSPGGTVSGCYETQRVLSGSTKPVIEAEVRTMAASAAYLLASTAKKIICDEHSSLGSVGTILTIYGEKGFLAKMGITRETFVSSVSPYKNDDPEDVGDEGRARIQSWLDKNGKIFVNRVAELRGVNPDKVLNDYGKGDVLVGAEAISAGVADGMIRGVVAAPIFQTEGQSMSKPTAKAGETEITVETESTADDESTAEASGDTTESTAAEDGGQSTAAPDSQPASAVASERARLQAIDELKIVGHDDLVFEAKYGKERMSADQLKARIFDAQRARQGADKDKLAALAKKDKEAAALRNKTPDPAAVQKDKDKAIARQAKKHVRP